MNKSIIKISVLMCIILLLVTIEIFSVDNINIIIVEDKSSGVYREFIPNNNEFALAYIHSVLLTPAEEYFTITDENKLLLQETVYESFGVGLPYEQEEDEDFEIKDGKFYLYLNKEFDEINMVISPIPKHRIIVGGEEYSLYDIVHDDTRSIKIYSTEKNIVQFGNKHIIL